MRAAARGHRRRWIAFALALTATAIVLLVGANAHLVYVAVASQPDCVPHATDVGDGAKFRAAAPAC
jgi:hypothetical protein